MLTELFQRQYDFEHQRRSEVTSATGAPIAAVTILFSALSVTLLDFPYARSVLTVLFIIFSAATLVGLVTAVFYIFRSIWNYVYDKLPAAPALFSHFKELENWHVSQGVSALDLSAVTEKDFCDYLNKRLSEAADWNGQNNDRRGNFLHMGTTALAFALALLLPTALLYAYAKAIAPEKVHRVELTQPAKVKENAVASTPSKDTTNSTSSPATTPSTSANPVSSPQAKPIGPPNSSFRTNTEIPSPQKSSDLANKSGS